jgi:hypothetical protein
MPKKKINQLIEKDFSEMPFTMDLYREFISKSNIEKLKLEDFVLKLISRGKKPAYIIKQLKKNHPDTNFDYPDFRKFMERNKEVAVLLKQESSLSSKRFMKARAEIEEGMRDLILFNKEVVRELNEKEDHTNLVSAMRSLKDAIMSYAKLSGHFNELEQKNNVNIINVITDKYEGSRLKDRTHRADFKDGSVDVNFEEVINESTGSEE